MADPGERIDVDKDTCPECGAVFIRSSNRQIYCTKACRLRAKNPRPDVQVCEVCGKEFPRGRRVASACSAACRSRRAYLEGKAAYIARAAAWKASNTDVVKAGAARYSAKTRDKRSAYHEANRDRFRAQRTAYARQWRAANPEKVRALEWRRRHAIRSHPHTRPITTGDWEKLVNRFRGCCAYCGLRTGDLHLDHVVPVSRGGRHGIGNALPACRGCNQSKTNFLLIEWRLRRRKCGKPLAGLGDVVARAQEA